MKYPTIMATRVERYFDAWLEEPRDFFSAEEMMRFAEAYHAKLTKEAPLEERKIVGPTREEVRGFFDEKGFTEFAADRAYNYYSELDWHDSKGKAIKKWKAKMIAVWFKPENQKKISEAKITLVAGNIEDLR